MLVNKSHWRLKVKKLFLVICGRLLFFLQNAHSQYMTYVLSKKLGGAIIQYPFKISGIENIIAGDYVNIGGGSTIMTTRAKLIIRGHFIAGPNLTIITGDHMPIIGKFLDAVIDSDKDHLDLRKEFDIDVIIEKDVWCGANVTILKGVHIGRGCILAAGAVVTRDMPPYCIAGGIPARPLKSRWSKRQILEHESKLYPLEERFSEEQIDSFVIIK